MFLMGQKDRKRLHIIRKVIDKEITQCEAGLAIELTDRQIRRIVTRVKAEGDVGICHKARGKRSNRQVKEKIKERVLKLCQTRYKGFGPTLASEKLLERDGIRISDETLRLWLKGGAIPYRGRAKRPHRQWRERKAHSGALVQLDGSHHAWFEDRGPESVLMAYIDDATGKAYGRFYEYEGTIPAMESFRAYVLRYGLPVALYADKHKTYRAASGPTVEEQLAGVGPMSQFERGLQDLDVKMIHAHSPQAKGRIERLFGTFQDRLIKEMRLAHINTLEEGNRFLESYLPGYNARFGVEPREAANLHRTAPGLLELNKALCIKTQRVLKNDFTIAYQTRSYQIKENVRAKKVWVEERLDGSIHITHQGKSLTYQEILLTSMEGKKPAKTKLPFRGKKKPAPLNHPWRQYEQNQRTKPRENAAN